MRDQILQLLLLIPGLLLGLTFHEYAHAIVADKLGDKTPRFQGRLTLNPFMHIDPIGFIMFLVFKFGWAKPVQTNPSAFKRYYKDDLKVSIAGPLANLVVAIFSGILLAFFIKLDRGINMNYTLAWVIGNILILSISINCTLFILNLIPLPGFDGFHVLKDLFPKFFYNIAEGLYKYQLIIMIVFLASPLARIIIGTPSLFIENLIYKICGLS